MAFQLAEHIRHAARKAAADLADGAVRPIGEAGLDVAWTVPDGAIVFGRTAVAGRTLYVLQHGADAAHCDCVRKP